MKAGTVGCPMRKTVCFFFIGQIMANNDVGFFIFAQLAGGGEEVAEVKIELRKERHEQKPEEDVVKYGEGS